MFHIKSLLLISVYVSTSILLSYQPTYGQLNESNSLQTSMDGQLNGEDGKGRNDSVDERMEHKQGKDKAMGSRDGDDGSIINLAEGGDNRTIAAAIVASVCGAIILAGLVTLFIVGGKAQQPGGPNPDEHSTNRRPATDDQNATSESTNDDKNVTSEPAKDDQNETSEPAKDDKNATSEPAKDDQNATSEPAKDDQNATSEPAKDDQDQNATTSQMDSDDHKSTTGHLQDVDYPPV